MIGAISYIDAPDVTLPLNVTGWHAVYVGFWNPHYAYDSGTTVKVALLRRSVLQLRIAEPEPAIDYNATYIKEAPFKAADLTGRTLQFGMVHGRFAKKAYIAYVKLVPLSAQQVADLQAERARKDTRVLRGTIDGYSYSSFNEYRTREHIMELIEPYRYSDVARSSGQSTCMATRRITRPRWARTGPSSEPFPSFPRSPTMWPGRKPPTTV